MNERDTSGSTSEGPFSGQNGYENLSEIANSSHENIEGAEVSSTDTDLTDAELPDPAAESRANLDFAYERADAVEPNNSSNEKSKLEAEWGRRDELVRQVSDYSRPGEVIGSAKEWRSHTPHKDKLYDAFITSVMYGRAAIGLVALVPHNFRVWHQRREFKREHPELKSELKHQDSKNRGYARLQRSPYYQKDSERLEGLLDPAGVNRLRHPLRSTRIVLTLLKREMLGQYNSERHYGEKTILK